MAYITLGIMLVYLAATRMHNIVAFNTQDWGYRIGTILIIYGAIMLIWNHAAGVKKWWL